ncbi:DUF1905 domain-containing protein [uncultured Polaribacter sp.]|uniref:DUF1905 domain-containing protein n=1 Tax=uncultured Polaribacter sp. TaxID=174711 RepID=UPI00259AFEE2|nr:DUF1905 domain-containing protein [uncultured Polaribacter sp.]
MKSTIKFTFTSKMWQDNEPFGWFFVSMTKEMSSEIRQYFKNQEEGWGRMKVVAIVKEIEWKTSIWFDTKRNIYLLPIKAEIRKKANLKVDSEFNISILL